MTEEQLREIVARAAAATPGPWECTGDGYAEMVASVEDIYIQPPTDYTLANPQEDADFIAHAREDIPALCADVRRLQAWQTAVIAAINGIQPGEPIDAWGRDFRDVEVMTTHIRQIRLALAETKDAALQTRQAHAELRGLVSHMQEESERLRAEVERLQIALEKEVSRP